MSAAEFRTAFIIWPSVDRSVENDTFYTEFTRRRFTIYETWNVFWNVMYCNNALRLLRSLKSRHAYIKTVFSRTGRYPYSTGIPTQTPVPFIIRIQFLSMSDYEIVRDFSRETKPGNVALLVVEINTCTRWYRLVSKKHFIRRFAHIRIPKRPRLDVLGNARFAFLVRTVRLNARSPLVFDLCKNYVDFKTWCNF